MLPFLPLGPALTISHNHSSLHAAGKIALLLRTSAMLRSGFSDVSEDAVRLAEILRWIVVYLADASPPLALYNANSDNL